MSTTKFELSSAFEPACNERVHQKFFEALQAIKVTRDAFCVAALVQSCIHKYTKCKYVIVPQQAQHKATKVAMDLEFLKSVMAVDLQFNQEACITLMWLCNFKPITSQLAELGIIDKLINSSTPRFDIYPIKGYEHPYIIVLRAIRNLLSSPESHKYITAQHIKDLAGVYFNPQCLNWDDQIFVILVSFNKALFAEALLVHLQRTNDCRKVESVLLKYSEIADLLVKTGAVDTLSVLFASQPTPSIAEALYHLHCRPTMDGLRTTLHMRLLFRGMLLMPPGNYNYMDIFSKQFPEEFCSAVFKEELHYQFDTPTVTEKHINTLQHALCYDTVHPILMEMAMLQKIFGWLADPTLAPAVSSLFCNLATKIGDITHPHITFHLLEPLVQHLIATNNSSQLAKILSALQTHKIVDEILADKGVLKFLVRVSPEDKIACDLLRKVEQSKVCAEMAKAGIHTNKLPLDFQARMLAYFRLAPISRDQQAPWYIDASLLQPVTDGRKFVTISGQPQDLQMVTELYQKSPVPGYDIKSVSSVYSEHLFNSFIARVESLQERAGKEVFAPHWRNNNRISSQEVMQRQKTLDIFQALAKHKYDKAPDVSFVLAWHGTHKSALESLFSTGFANLASTDAGFFGKGLYTTPDADYAHRVYSSGALLLNWVAAFSPFPVLAQDEPELAEKGNFRNYDAHFVPVYSPNHPNTKVYHACNVDEEHQYSELVVFESSQMLARYIVELQPTFPQEVAPITIEKNKEAPKKSKTGMVTWSVAEVCAWFSTLQLSQDYSSLLQTNGISGDVLQSMTQQDWKDIGMTHFGDSRSIALKVSRYED